MNAEALVQQMMSLHVSKYEACAYLALLGCADSSAAEIADRAKVPRQRVYDVLASLHERGLIVTRRGRPVRYTALEPREALEALLESRLREQQAENKRLAALVADLVSALGSSSSSDAGIERGEARAPAQSHSEPFGGL